MPEESGSAPDSGWASLSDDYGARTRLQKFCSSASASGSEHGGGGGIYMISWVIEWTTMVEFSQMRTKVTNSPLRNAAVQKEENAQTPTQYCSKIPGGCHSPLYCTLHRSLPLSVPFPFKQSYISFSTSAKKPLFSTQRTIKSIINIMTHVCTHHLSIYIWMPRLCLTLHSDTVIHLCPRLHSVSCALSPGSECKRCLYI